MTSSLRIAVLAKQVPRSEELRLGSGGRLERDPSAAEINAYCRRAIAKGVELARETGGSCTVFTLGPPSAREILEEAIGWGADDGVLISDPAFAGSDTYMTAHALAAAIRRRGPFGMVLAGLNSVDADTGQVGPQVAELLDLPFLSGVKALTVDGDRVTARCERETGTVTARLRLPALLTAAERLCRPCKVPPEERLDPAKNKITLVTAAELGPGPKGLWGQAGSPSRVGEIVQVARDRRRIRLSGPPNEQARSAAELIIGSGVLDQDQENTTAAVPWIPAAAGEGPVVAVIGEPGAYQVTRELLGAAAELAAGLGGRAVLLARRRPDPAAAWADGADEVIVFGVGARHGGARGGSAGGGADAEASSAGGIDGAAQAEAAGPESAVAALAAWASHNPEAAAPGAASPGAASPGVASPRVARARRLPWAILVPSTAWGREVAGRLSIRLGAGLVGDAVGLDLHDGRLVCWKPALGGQLIAAVTVTSAVQMATVRPGALPQRGPREGGGVARVQMRHGRPPEDRVLITGRVIDDDPERLARATAIIGVGSGVDPARYGELDPLLDILGAELAATRKVTDAGSLPRGRQVGLTGRMIAPRLYILLGASGKHNHMIATRGAGLIVAVNPDPAAPVFDAADIGITADWAETARLLAAELATRLTQPVSSTRQLA